MSDKPSDAELIDWGMLMMQSADRIEELEAALAPFAAYAEHVSPGAENGLRVLSIQIGRLRWAHVTVGDFRRARIAIARKEGSDNGN